MATNNTKKLPLEPRLPIVGGTDYDQRLSRALHDILRQLSARVNALDGSSDGGSGTGFTQLTAASTMTIPAGVQFVNVVGSSNINTLGGGDVGQVVVMTFLDEPTLYALGILAPMTPYSIAVIEGLGGGWALRGLVRNVDAVLASGSSSWSAGTGFSQTISHGLGYTPDIEKVQLQVIGLLPTNPTANSFIMSVSAVSATRITVVRPNNIDAYSFAWRIYS